MIENNALVKTKEGREALSHEHAILQVSELVAGLLESSKMSRSELAKKSGVTKQVIDQMLAGYAVMNLSGLVSILAAFDHVLEVSSKPINDLYGN